VAVLCESEPNSVNLYERRRGDGQFVLYRERNIPVAASDFERLRARGVTHLFIAAEEQSEHQSFLRRNLDALLNNDNVPVSQRFQVLNQVTYAALRDSFATDDTDQAVATATTMGSTSVDFLAQNDVVARDLFSVLRHDYHTFTHSANVSGYCVVLAKRLGIANDGDLKAIATGALLHDIGKLQIPNAILSKVGPLTEIEFDVVKRHPITGFNKCCDREDLSWEQLMIVYQHHEKCNGGGYPVGIMQAEIHEWARICAVVDVFDALTSLRPYKPARRIADALDYLLTQSGKALDAEMVSCWNDAMRP
jgi:HD-GYP domain-containing protein (c-di-GMP phosphodiesterase class II)